MQELRGSRWGGVWGGGAVAPSPENVLKSTLKVPFSCYIICRFCVKKILSYRMGGGFEPPPNPPPRHATDRMNSLLEKKSQKYAQKQFTLIFRF